MPLRWDCGPGLTVAEPRDEWVPFPVAAKITDGAGTMTTKISALICTRDRPDTVGQALESVARCEHPNLDVHVLDQSTTDETRSIVMSVAEKFSETRAILYHHLDVAGLSRAYNAGVRMSDGSILACTDDDVIVPTDWLDPVVRAFETDPEIGLVYGQVLVPESLERAGVDGLVVPALSWDRRVRLHEDQRNFKVWGMGANMAFRRDVHERVGGFDEAMGGGAPLRSSQDYDFALRTYRAGYAVLLEPDMKVDHYGTRTTEQWPATGRNYGIGDGAFYSKHARCGDVVAARLLLYKFASIGWHTIRDSWRERRFTGLTAYDAGFLVGLREAARFGIDRPLRLYRATARARTGPTEANPVTGSAPASR